MSEHRLAVHEKLHEILIEDALGFEVEVRTVEGDVWSRVEQVTRRVDVGSSGRRNEGAKRKSKR
ncbi:MAG TPA: hypothetical protein VM580_27375 [Labilithrix sp.]|nr:hypothetical protein [Labilithrix sp.]